VLPHLNFHSASCNLATALVAVLIARENAVALAYVSGTGLLRYEPKSVSSAVGADRF
jgi:hypothetical protein